jgi:hypothetical protein
MQVKKILILGIAFFSSFAISSISCHAESSGAHPAYLHALSNLRLMRAYLDRATADERIDDESLIAIDEIDSAIHEINIAAIDDGKNLQDHPPIDLHISRTDRFNRAIEAGNTALNEIKSEDDTSLETLKHHTIDHIARADNIIGHILEHRNRR